MKLRFLAGIATGYVLGTRAGREQYDRVVQALSGSELVQQARGELDKLRGRESESGTSAEAVDVAADLVLPELEPSASAQDAGDAGEARRAKRITPPAAP